MWMKTVQQTFQKNTFVPTPHDMLSTQCIRDEHYVWKDRTKNLKAIFLSASKIFSTDTTNKWDAFFFWFWSKTCQILIFKHWKTLYKGFRKNKHVLRLHWTYRPILISVFFALYSPWWLVFMSSNNLQDLSVLKEIQC